MEEKIDCSSENIIIEKDACIATDTNSVCEDSLPDDGEQQATLSPVSDKLYNKEANKIPSSNSVRSTRSKDNPDFVAKQRSFIAKVIGASASLGNYDHLYAITRPDTPGKRKRELNNSCQPAIKRKKSNNKSDSVIQEWQNDNCCWECHREGQIICCEMCPRVFHLKCAGLEKEPEDDWACSECRAVMLAENVENRSRGMQIISVDQLCTLLKYALKRLKSMPAMEPFCNPVDEEKFPTYWDMVLHPVDFTTLEANIKRKFYGSTESFLSDARWIVHNSVIFNGANSKVTSLARTLIKILKQELSEIETCPDCYENAHCKPESWFTEACRLAHPLVWAKLKGFPYWPAKAVKWKDTNVDVRFFGRHDRSWVPLKECFLFSEQMPTPLKSKNKTLETCLVEVEEHIEKLKIKFGKFNYAAHRTPFDPYDLDQIRILLPLYKGPAILRIRSQVRSISRQSGHSGTDDDTSSITSTDSVTSFSRIHKKSIKERLTINTPDTDDYECYNNEEYNQRVESCEKKSDCEEHEEKVTWNSTKLCSNKDEIDDKENHTESDMGPTSERSSFFDHSSFSADRPNELEKKIPLIGPSLSNESFIDDDALTLNEDVSSLKEEFLSSIKKSPSRIEGPYNQNDITQVIEQTSSADLQSEDVAPLTVPDAHSEFTSNIKKEIPSSTDSKELSLLNFSNVPLKEELSSEAKLKFLKSIKPRPLSHKLKLLKWTKSANLKSEKEHLDSVEQSYSIPNIKGLDTDESLPNNNETKVFESVNEKDQNQVNNLSIIDDLERINMLLRNESNDNSNDSLKGSNGTDNGDKESCLALSDATINIMSKLSGSIKFRSDIGSNQGEDMKQKNRLEKFSLGVESDSTTVKKHNHFKDDEGGLENKSDLDEDQLSDDDRMHIDEGPFENENVAASGSINKPPLSFSKSEGEESEKNQKVMQEDYFQGFLNEISLSKNVDICKNSVKNTIGPVGKGSKSYSQDNESASETDEKDPKENLETPEDEADRFNEQLLSNSSLTIGKVSLPKSVKLQKTVKENSESKNVSKLKAFLPSINVTSISQGKSSEFDSEKDNSSNDEEMLVKKHETKGSSESSAIDFKNFASKIFHNITISSKSIEAAEMREKHLEGNEKQHCFSEKKESFSSMENKKNNCKEDKLCVNKNSNRIDNSASESLLEAVRLVQNIGNIAIKRVDNKTLEHTSGNDSVTISVAGEQVDHRAENTDSCLNKSKSMYKKEGKEENDPLASIRSNGCVSFTKASDQEKDKVKMPTGVDTTRLSPSISITPVSSSASPTDKSPKIKSNPSPSISGSQQNFPYISSASPVISNAGNTTPILTSASPALMPPHMLTQALPSPTNSVRSIFSPHLPGLSLQGGTRTPITSPAPGLRMMANASIMMAGRLPGPQIPIVRHLPPDAGPLSCELHKHSQKLAEIMRNSLEEVLAGLVGIGTPEARLAAIQMELERSNWRHQQELVEVRHNADVMLVEIRANLEAEKIRAVEEGRRQMEQKVVELRRQTEIQFNEKISEVKRQGEIEKQRAIEETKKKQWCANCGKEALFFCCWNTSYCDYPCQQSHWPQHMSVCGQNSDSGGGGGVSTDGASESVNGDSSCHSSRGPTPVQHLRNNTQIKNLMEEDDNILADDRRRRKRKEDQSPIYADGMGRSISPACSVNSLGNVNIPMGGASSLSQPLSALGGSMRANMGAPSMAAIAAMAGAPSPGMAMKMAPRFMQHSMMQQQPLFHGVDPRMIMMMSRNMGSPALMMGRQMMPTFRPRFM